CARRTFEEACDALGFDLAKLCDEGPPEELDQTTRSQPALLACSVAAYRVVRGELGLAPTYAAGHSLGEISALACAGVLSFADALCLVEQRGRFMQDAVPPSGGRMAAVIGASADDGCAACDRAMARGAGFVTVANVNADDQIVLSGEAAAVADACAQLEGRGAVAHPLKISIPAHSRLMQ